MKAKYIIIIFGIAFLSGLVGIIFFGPNSSCSNYAIDEQYKITDSTEKPEGSWENMRSPIDDSPLEMIIIDPDEPEIDDESWRFAYYSEEENIFWVADMPGFTKDWYGAFEGYPCLE